MDFSDVTLAHKIADWMHIVGLLMLIVGSGLVILAQFVREM